MKTYHLLRCVLISIATIVRLAKGQDSFNFETIRHEPSTMNKNQPATFDATFDNLWIEDNHPYRYPNGSEHWSPFVYATHSSGYTLWGNGGMASPGVELISETGSTRLLMSEIRTQQQNNNYVLSSAVGPMIPNAFEGAESSVSGICVDQDHPYVSAISMIAPTPFSGLYNLRLWDDNTGTWYREIELYVYPWDAGTEEGDRYSLGNAPTSPQEPISPFMANDDEDAVFVSEGESSLQVLPVGVFTFTLQGSTSACDSLSAVSRISSSRPSLAPTNAPTATPTQYPSSTPSGRPSLRGSIEEFIRSND